MKALLAAIIGAAAIGGCGSDPVEDAQREYDIVAQNNGTSSELCQASRKLSAAALAAKSEDRYRRAKMTEKVYCVRADMGL